MRFFLFSLLFICFYISNVHAGVPDIKSMNKLSRGKFRVVCTSGRTETVSAEDILSNDVCGMSSTVPMGGVICTGNQSRDEFFITRLSDRHRMGGKLSFNKCQKTISSAQSGLVCTGDERRDDFFVTNISNGQRIGGKLTFKACLKSIGATR